METTNPIIYPIFALVTTAVVVIVLVNLASVLLVKDLRQHYVKVVTAWRNVPLEFVRGPEIANFLNQRRLFGARGNGVLVLTPTELRFARIAAENEIIIPLDSIAQVQRVKRFNGYRASKPFLAIKDTSGTWTGFQVGNAERWEEDLQTRLPHLAIPSDVTPALPHMHPILA